MPKTNQLARESLWHPAGPSQLERDHLALDHGIELRCPPRKGVAGVWMPSLGTRSAGTEPGVGSGRSKNPRILAGLRDVAELLDPVEETTALSVFAPQTLDLMGVYPSETQLKLGSRSCL